jgi:hypothetical protein
LVKFYASATEDLILYARQLGWFHAIPKSDKPSKEKAKNRAEKIKDNGGTPLMPEVDAEYLIGYWQDLGLISSNGMGATSLTASEIMAWTRLSAVELEPWEFNCIRQMSQHYASSLHNSENPDEPPPFGSLAQEFDRTVVGSKVTNAFKAFIMAGRKK